MSALKDTIRSVLDEHRMLILGAQVLPGPGMFFGLWSGFTALRHGSG